ncbi:WYL domain-containing protein [Flavobacterium sp.]|jgi:predicted DNA-binding transcriptional regulator YafY|uniref:WYL domain-containing protein n=1 Tax=Flavobacterium sp. TaxID=239 RepID=UPI0037C0F914
MTHQTKTNRLRLVYTTLKIRPFSLNELTVLYASSGYLKSRRQIQRDLKEVELFFQEKESIKSFYVLKEKYFHIQSTLPSIDDSNEGNALHYTSFNLPKSKPNESSKRALINEAISKNNMLFIRDLKNDETGDNFSFTSKKIQIIPVLMIFHRNNYYIGGYNVSQNQVVIYGIRQMEGVSILPKTCKPKDYYYLVSKELDSRFGVTKNINSNIYIIQIEISNVLSEFVQNHTWHHSQQFEKKKGKTLLTLTCGINRELLGWLFQWMYNIKIIEPKILRTYYEKAIKEVMAVHNDKKSLVYKNIFETNEMN